MKRSWLPPPSSLLYPLSLQSHPPQGVDLPRGPSFAQEASEAACRAQPGGGPQLLACVPGRTDACRPAGDAACTGSTNPGSGGAGARAMFTVARAGSVGVVSLRSAWDPIETPRAHHSPDLAGDDRGWRRAGDLAGALGTSTGGHTLPETTRRDRWPASSTALASGGMIVRVDGTLRQWPAAAFSLMILAILFGTALLGAW